MSDEVEVPEGEVNEGAFAELAEAGEKGPVVMLNLLRFRDVADYSAAPELEPTEPISGEAAYRLYMEHTLPYLTNSGGEILFTTNARDFTFEDKRLRGLKAEEITADVTPLDFERRPRLRAWSLRRTRACSTPARPSTSCSTRRPACIAYGSRTRPTSPGGDSAGTSPGAASRTCSR